MNVVNPTTRILSLFQRGRYVSLRSLAAKESHGNANERMQQRERFCVAAIAMALEHDEDFKTFFLGAIGMRSSQDNISIHLEPNFWGDLVLEGSRTVLVVEFKVGALLCKHQDPKAEIFHEGGYGAKIRMAYAESGKAVEYVVVGAHFDPCEWGKLPCRAVPWNNLICKPRSTSSLIDDLYESLGHLGIPVFLARNMKPHLSSDASAAMNVYSALAGVLQTAALPIGKPDSGAGYIGYEIGTAGSHRNAKSLHARMVQVIAPERKRLAWIGYENGGDGTGIWLIAYFYCGPIACGRVLQHLRKCGYPDADTDGNDVFVREAKPSCSDTDWFLKVLCSFK